jgi:hypothetical protein
MARAAANSSAAMADSQRMPMAYVTCRPLSPPSDRDVVDIGAQTYEPELR